MLIINVLASVALSFTSITGVVNHPHGEAEISNRDTYYQDTGVLSQWPKRAIQNSQAYYFPSNQTEKQIDSCGINFNPQKFGYIDFDLIGCIMDLKDAYASSVFYNSTMLPELK